MIHVIVLAVAKTFVYIKHSSCASLGSAPVCPLQQSASVKIKEFQSKCSLFICAIESVRSSKVIAKHRSFINIPSSDDQIYTDLLKCLCSEDINDEELSIDC